LIVFLASLFVTLIHPASGQHATALQDSDQPSRTSIAEALATPTITKVCFTCAALAEYRP
jgi:hypothetical protein